jgi:hypothetical protein
VAGSIALIASTWLALTVVYGNGVAITLGVVVALLLAWSWFWIPLVNFNKDHS